MFPLSWCQTTLWIFMQNGDTHSKKPLSSIAVSLQHNYTINATHWRKQMMFRANLLSSSKARCFSKTTVL